MAITHLGSMASRVKRLALALVWGLLFLGLSQCGTSTQKKGSDHSHTVPDLPPDWSGADDWSGSPWALEDE